MKMNINGYIYHKTALILRFVALTRSTDVNRPVEYLNVEIVPILIKKE